MEGVPARNGTAEAVPVTTCVFPSLSAAFHRLERRILIILSFSLTRDERKICSCCILIRTSPSIKKLRKRSGKQMQRCRRTRASPAVSEVQLRSTCKSLASVTSKRPYSVGQLS